MALGICLILFLPWKKKKQKQNVNEIRFTSAIKTPNLFTPKFSLSFSIPYIVYDCDNKTINS